MKTIIKLTNLAALAAVTTTPAFALGIDSTSLLVDCTATAVVATTSKAAYSPGQPPKFRFPGVDPSGGFQAEITLKDLSPGCDALAQKYQLDLHGLAHQLSLSVKAPESQSQVSEIAAKYQGKELTLQLKQSFGYNIKQYLPLFPLAHDEYLQFTSNDPQTYGSLPLPIEIAKIYGTKTPAQLSDGEKLVLAEKAANLMSQGHVSAFSGLFLQLKPTDPALQKQYGNFVLKTFHEWSSGKGYDQQYLRFHVGGPGSFEGAPLAAAFNQLTQQGFFGQTEIEDAIFAFPTLLLTGIPAKEKNTCLKTDSAILQNVLQKVAAKLPVMTAFEKYQWKDGAAAVTGKVLYGACPLPLTPPIKELATTVLGQL